MRQREHTPIIAQHTKRCRTTLPVAHLELLTNSRISTHIRFAFTDNKAPCAEFRTGLHSHITTFLHIHKSTWAMWQRCIRMITGTLCTRNFYCTMHIDVCARSYCECNIRRRLYICQRIGSNTCHTRNNRISRLLLILHRDD